MEDFSSTMATVGQYRLFWPSLPQLDPTRLLASALTSGIKTLCSIDTVGVLTSTPTAQSFQESTRRRFEHVELKSTLSIAWRR